MEIAINFFILFAYANSGFKESLSKDSLQYRMSCRNCFTFPDKVCQNLLGGGNFPAFGLGLHCNGIIMNVDVRLICKMAPHAISSNNKLSITKKILCESHITVGD